jgi:hypothetical protein
MTAVAWCFLIGFLLMLVSIVVATVFMRGAAEVPLPPPVVTPPDYVTRTDLEHVVDQLRPLVPHVTVPEREPDPPPPVVAAAARGRAAAGAAAGPGGHAQGADSLRR